MSFFGMSFGGNADIDIYLDGQEERKMAELKDENGRKERHYLYFDGESVTGKINITLHRKTSKLEHQGIKIEFIGQIELYYDRGNHHEFLSLVKQLDGPGVLTQNTSFDFEFNQVEKPYECYTGANVRLRYFLRVTIVRRLTDMTKEMDLLVHTLATYPEMNNPIKMEVGIEECLHIEFEYNKSKYHLKDVIVGKIYFLLVRIKIRHMEVAIIKRETTGAGPNTFHDNDTIAKYEIMDGAPVKGESIPIRVFLAGYDLTPTMRDINKKFSVKYYLNLVLVDEEDRRYFKQQEITLWRKGERLRKPHQVGVPGGPASYMVPHAMARHEGSGDQPVRTAPTPSEPNTPVIDGPGAVGVAGTGMPGPGVMHQHQHQHQQQQRSTPEKIPEELEEEEEEEEESAQASPENEVPPAVSAVPEAAVVAPEVAAVAPEVTAAAPEVVAAAPEVTAAAPEAAAPQPPSSDASPPALAEDAAPTNQAPAAAAPAPETANQAEAAAKVTNGKGASPESPHKFMESPPPMDEDATGTPSDDDAIGQEEDDDEDDSDAIGQDMEAMNREMSGVSLGEEEEEFEEKKTKAKKEKRREPVPS